MSSERYLNHPTFGMLYQVSPGNDGRDIYATLYAQKMFFLVERLFQNIFLRIDQGAESLLSKKEIIIKTNRFRTLYPSKSFNVIVNTLSICFICIAIFLRKLYGAL